MTRGRTFMLTALTASMALQAASGASAALVATLVLGPGARGAMVLGLTVSAIAAIVAGLGTGAALRSRLPGLDGAAAGRLAVTAYTWWSLVAIVLSGVIALGAAAVCARVIDAALVRPGFLVGLAVTTAAQTAMSQQADAWFAAGRFRAGSGWAVLASGASVVGLVVGAAVRPDSAGLLLGQGLGTAVVAGAGWGRLRSAGLAAWRPGPLRPLLAEARGLIRVGTPVLGTTLGFVIALRADRFVLGAVAGTAVVGVYSLAATLGELPRLVPNAVGQLLLRDVAVNRATAPIRRSRSLAIRLTVGASALVGLAGWALIVPVFGPPFAPARPVLLVLLGAEVCFVPYGLAVRGLVGGGWTATAGTLGLAGAVGAVVLFVSTIPLWTMMGAAMASMFVYCGLSIVAWRILGRRLDGPAPVVPVTEARPVVAVTP